VADDTTRARQNTPLDAILNFVRENVQICIDIHPPQNPPPKVVGSLSPQDGKKPSAARTRTLGDPGNTRYALPLFPPLSLVLLIGRKSQGISWVKG